MFKIIMKNQVMRMIQNRSWWCHQVQFRSWWKSESWGRRLNNAISQDRLNWWKGGGWNLACKLAVWHWVQRFAEKDFYHEYNCNVDQYHWHVHDWTPVSGWAASSFCHALNLKNTLIKGFFEQYGSRIIMMTFVGFNFVTVVIQNTNLCIKQGSMFLAKR